MERVLRLRISHDGHGHPRFRWVQELNDHPGHCAEDCWHPTPEAASDCFHGRRPNHAGDGGAGDGGAGDHREEDFVTEIYRQGDVALVRVTEAPAGKRVEAEHGRLILARGEVTGHHHSVAVMAAELVDAAEGVFLRIMATTPLEHQEHAPITLDPGVYRVIRQREYQPGALPSRVAD